MELLHTQLRGGDAHETALLLLQQLCGCPLPEIRKMRQGKPYFPDFPLHFSISHTPRHVFCATSERPIGIDAEERDRDIRLDLAEKILSPMEFSQFQQAEDKSLALLTFWVLKEAAAKCTGEGLRIYPNHTNFSLNDPRVREIDGCLVAVIEQESM